MMNKKVKYKPTIQEPIDPERVEYEEALLQNVPTVIHTNSSELTFQLSALELIGGLVALTCWFGFFSGGILVSTEQYRVAIASPTASMTFFANWLMVLSFWTITNIGILACIAAFLGALGRRTQFTVQTASLLTEVDKTILNKHSLATYYVSAVMRGFGTYSLMLAGLLVLATEALISPSQAEYMRLAPTVSIVSFYAGYDPSLFAGLLSRVKGFVNSPPQES